MAVDSAFTTIKVQIAELNRSRKSSESGCTIFRVPPHVKSRREHLFHPQTVSIGPYHYADPMFADMEKVKIKFLSVLLPTEAQLWSCISMLKELEDKARRCYFHSAKLESEEFVQMLLKDGCFIIQFLLILNKIKSESTGVCGRKWIQDMIIHDLLLLENQIPFFILQTLYDHFAEIHPGLFVGRPKGFLKTFNLFELIDQLFLSTMPRKQTSLKDHNNMHYHHLVDLYHHCLCSRVAQPVKSRGSLGGVLKYLNILKLISTLFSYILFRIGKKLGGTKRDLPHSIPSATWLHDSGVELKKKPSSDGMFDISFTWDGVLEIPLITLNQEMNFLLANLVAFEQCTGDKDQEVSSYAIVMDHLVDTPEDVELLMREGILERMLPSNEEATHFFNQLSSSCRLNYHDHKFKDLFEDIDNYNRIYWHAWRARLMRDYFSNPWAVVSFLVGAPLLILNALEGIYSVLYYAKQLASNDKSS